MTGFYTGQITGQILYECPALQIFLYLEKLKSAMECYTSISDCIVTSPPPGEKKNKLLSHFPSP